MLRFGTKEPGAAWICQYGMGVFQGREWAFVEKFLRRSVSQFVATMYVVLVAIVC